MALVKHGLLVIVWLGAVGYTVREVRAVRGIYVNNHKIDKFETNRVKLVHPGATPAPGSGNYGSKHGLLTKVNFTSPQQYYQYLVGEDPVNYVDLLWGKNKTQLPSIFRIGSGPAATTQTTNVSYADETSPIKNTLNNTSVDYFGDYQRPEELQSTSTTLTPPVSTTRSSPIKPSRKRNKKPPARQPVQLLGAPENASGFNTTELTPETLSLLSRYYSFSCTLTPLRTAAPAIPTQSTVSTTRRTKTRYLTTSSPSPKATTKRPKPSPAPTKQKKPVVYVDPPVIKRISGVLESVYKFMENALTSTEYVDESEEIRAVRQSAMPNATLKPPKASKVKRNTYTNHAVGGSSGENVGDVSRSTVSGTEETWLPVSSNDVTAKVTKHFTPKLVTISGLPSTLSSDGNKNKMTTNIQVTSEYTAATPPTVSLSKPATDSSGEESSEEESDEDYFDGFGGFGGEDEDDDEDEEDDDDEDTGDSNESVRPNRQTALSNDKDYDEVAAHVELPVRIKRVKKRRKKKRPAASYEDTAEYSDEDDSDEGEDEYDQRDESIEDDDDDDEDDEPADAPEGFFNRLFSSFGRIFRSLGFGGAARGTPDDYGGRSTTPRVLATEWGRRPTRSTSGQPTDARPLLERTPASWFYLTNELEEEDAPEELVLPTLGPPIATDSSWFEWMMPWDFFNPWSSSADVEQEDVTEATTTKAPLTGPAPSEDPVSTSSPTATPVVSGWFAQLFGAKPTTKLPPTLAPTAPVPKPEQLLSALAQYVAQSVTTNRPTGPPAAVVTQPASYVGYQLWRIRVHSEEHLQRLQDYRQSPEGLRLQWWTSPALMRSTDVLVPPGSPGDALREFLEDEGLRYEPTIRDLGRAIVYENPRLTRREQAELELLHGHPLTWYRYHRYGDMVKYMHHLQRRHPDRVQLLHIGRSYEGRPVTVVRVSFANHTRPAGRSRKPAKKRPAVFVEAGAHGHQWIGPAVATWLLNRLMKASQIDEITNSTMLKTFQAYDWYVLPVLNPDGYEYSHKHDRMWSKNRAKISPPPAAGVGQAFLESAINWWHTGNHTRGPVDCLGVDLNRNWAYRWQQAASPDRRTPCSDTYAGSEPFSEPEVRALRDFLLTRRRNVRLYLSLQAYGQQLSYPDLEVEETGHGHLPGTYSDIHDMASGGLEAMRAEAGEFLYSLEPVGGTESYGTAAGYARHGAGIRYSYTLHLPDTGTHGFLLPPSNIVPIGKDVFELLQGMIDHS